MDRVEPERLAVQVYDLSQRETRRVRKALLPAQRRLQLFPAGFGGGEGMIAVADTIKEDSKQGFD